MTDHSNVLRALEMLSKHSDEPIRDIALFTLGYFDVGDSVSAYTFLATAADMFNPSKRDKHKQYRQTCLNNAHKHIYPCIVAQLFYELSEGLYRQHTSFLYPVVNAKRKVLLTQAA